MTPDVVSFVDHGLGNTSYLIGLEDDRAAVLDPVRDPSRYLAYAKRRGWSIVAAMETHLHADFISGGRELTGLGARLHAPAGSELAFDHAPLEAGGEVDLGGLTMRALPTPGHTPEHLSYLLSDGPTPLALFSGGSLLVGSVARTDLISPAQTEELTRRLFRSLRQVLAPLPDNPDVYPTHGAGSFCTASSSGTRVTTLGTERRHNPFLQYEDEDLFVAALLSGLGTYPTYYRHLRERNRRGPRLFSGGLPELPALKVDAVKGLLADGAVLVDVRPTTEWAGGHIPGALNITLRDAFSSWLGWLVDIDAPLVFVLGPGQDRADLLRSCLAIGYENLAGELSEGMEAWVAAGERIAHTEALSFDEIGARRLIDVRQLNEWEMGHLADATHIELGSLAVTEAPAGPLAVHCGHGQRAASAASLLERVGRTDVAVVVDDPIKWSQTRGLRLVSE